MKVDNPIPINANWASGTNICIADASPDTINVCTHFYLGMVSSFRAVGTGAAGTAIAVPHFMQIREVKVREPRLLFTRGQFYGLSETIGRMK